MKDGDLSPGIGKMQQSLKQLRLQWLNTKDQWHDVAQQRFEENHVRPVEEKSVQAIEAMGRMGLVLAQAIRECS